MEFSQKNALVLGASGLTGKFCLQYLLDSGYYKKVVALVRSELNISHPRLTQYVIDFYNTAAMEGYYDGIDDVFCCLGTTIQNAGSQSAFRRVDFHIPTEAANMASEHGVKQFLAISSVGAYNRSKNFYLRVKGEMEAGISQFHFDAIHIFRPSLLLGNRAEVRKGENFAKFMSRIFSWLLEGKYEKYKPIEASQVAKAMIMAAQSGSAGTHYYNTHQITRLADKYLPGK